MTAPTVSAPVTPTRTKNHLGLLFAGLMVTMLLASLNQTVLSTALPTIVGELNGVGQMTWVITGYILASTITMPVYGRISDLFGRKPVLLAAIRTVPYRLGRRRPRRQHRCPHRRSRPAGPRRRRPADPVAGGDR